MGANKEEKEAKNKSEKLLEKVVGYATSVDNKLNKAYGPVLERMSKFYGDLDANKVTNQRLSINARKFQDLEKKSIAKAKAMGYSGEATSFTSDFMNMQKYINAEQIAYKTPFEVAREQQGFYNAGANERMQARSGVMGALGNQANFQTEIFRNERKIRQDRNKAWEKFGMELLGAGVDAAMGFATGGTSIVAKGAGNVAKGAGNVLNKA